MNKRGVDVNSINREVLNLFKKWNKKWKPWKSIKRIPMLYDRLAFRPDILFIGLNPSFKAKGIAKYCFKAFKSKGIKVSLPRHEVNSMYNLSQTTPAKRRLSIQLQRISKSYYHTYYKPLNDFSENCGLHLWNPEDPSCGTRRTWEHIDLFFERDKNPSKLKSIKHGKVTPFGLEQLRFTEKLIKKIQPKNIIVVNRISSEIAAEYCSLLRRYDPKKKRVILHLGKAHVCHVFFSRSWSWGVGKKLKDIQDEIKASL